MPVRVGGFLLLAGIVRSRSGGSDPELSALARLERTRKAMCTVHGYTRTRLYGFVSPSVCG